MAKGKALLPCRPVFLTDESFSTQNWPMKSVKTQIEERLHSNQPIVEKEEEFFDVSNEQPSNIASLLEEKKPSEP